MTPPFPWTLRGHGRVINWPSFKVVVSQGIWEPEERERDGQTATCRAVRTYTITKFANLGGCGLWCPRKITIVTLKIADHKSP